MIKSVKLLLLLLSLILFLPLASGQEQNSFRKSISEKVQRYFDAVPREEVFVHTDRTQFIAGENLWLNVYLVDRKSNKPSPDSKIAYLEILNSENRPVAQKRVRLENGFGPGQLTLPDTLSTGKYTLRAYSNLMKNFLPFNCFMQEIDIYNAISDKTFSVGALPVNGLPKDPADISSGVSGAGFTLYVDNLKPDELIINIKSDNYFRSANNNLCYLLIQTHGVINTISTIQLSSESITVKVPKADLISGINQVTLFDSKGLPLIDRFIYTTVVKENILTLNSPDSCNKREKISFGIEVKKEAVSTLKNANISISVSPLTDFSVTSDLADYLVFGTEFGPIPAEIKNHRLSELSPETLDNFLLTVKSNWVDWSILMSGIFPPLKYRTENEDHFLTGRLMGKNSKIAGSDKYLFLSTPGKKAVFQYARTDKDGNFSFKIPVTEDEKDLIIQPEDITENNVVRIESSFSEDFIPSGNIRDTSFITIPEYISKWSVNYQVGKIYETASTGEPLKPLVFSPAPQRFYGKPDIELLMDEYIQLPVMQEVFFELTPGVFLKNKKSVYKMSVADPVDNRIYEKPPVLFIDGVVVNDAAVIAALDPEKVEKIDAVKDLYLVGDYLFFGIVNVISRAGDYSSVSLPDYAVRLRYKVADRVLSFISPDYSTDAIKQNRIPDFRNTLYWNPSVKPDDNGKVSLDYFASDVPGDYEVNIQGITASGKAMSLRKIIRIK